MRAVHIYYAMRDMLERRRIGKNPFRETRPEKLAPELAKRLGSDDHKRNRRALRELEAIGVWCVKNGVWRPAERIGELDIDPCERRDLGNWLASLTRRKRLIVPRHLLEGLPLLNGSQLALNLELLIRCTWRGDKRETTATVSLRIRRVAARWDISERTVQYALKNGLGPNVRLEQLEDIPGWHMQRHGCRYRVVSGRGVNIPEPDTDDLMPESGQELSGLTANAGHDVAPPPAGHDVAPPAGHDVAPPPGEIEHGFAPPLILDLTPPLRGDLHPSDPPGSAKGEDTGAYQPEEKTGEDKEVTTGDDADISTANTTDLLPADSDPEDENVTAQDLDTLLADTAAPLPTDPEPESTPKTPSDADSTLPPPDRHDMIPADLGDLGRLRVIYGQDVACGCLPHCEANWLRFVTAAVHARRVPNILNRPALFRKIIKSGNRHVLGDGRVVSYLTDEDEQAALAWIKAQEPAPVDRELRLVRKPDAPPALSPDADLVVRFQEVLAFTRYDGDVFLAFKRTDEGHGWDRARFDAALAELATPPEPACLSLAVLPDLLAWGSELAQIDPPIAALGLPTPAVNTSLQKPTEAPTPQREKMEMMTSQKESIPRPAVPLPEDEPVSLRYFSDARVLSDDGHLLKLYAEAVSSGLVSDDEDGFLRFVAAAEHALNASGVPDRPLLFKTIVRGKWGLVPNAAIDRARERLHTINFKRPSHGGPDDVAS